MFITIVALGLPFGAVIGLTPTLLQKRRFWLVGFFVVIAMVWAFLVKDFSSHYVVSYR